MIAFAVYTQNYPTYEYEPQLESIWDTAEGAITEGNRIKNQLPFTDYIWINTIALNKPSISALDEAAYFYKSIKEL